MQGKFVLDITFLVQNADTTSHFLVNSEGDVNFLETRGEPMLVGRVAARASSVPLCDPFVC